MVKTAEQKVRDRYTADLLAGKAPRALTDANRAILEEIRTEVATGKRTLESTTSKAVKRIKVARDQSIQQLQDAKEHALLEIDRASALVSASASASEPNSATPDPQAAEADGPGATEPSPTVPPSEEIPPEDAALGTPAEPPPVPRGYLSMADRIEYERSLREWLARCAAKRAAEEMKLPFEWGSPLQWWFVDGVTRFYDDPKFLEVPFRGRVEHGLEAAHAAVASEEDRRDRKARAIKAQKVEAERRQEQNDVIGQLRFDAESRVIAEMHGLLKACDACRDARKNSHELRCSTHQAMFEAGSAKLLETATSSTDEVCTD